MLIKRIFFSIFFIIVGWILCHVYSNFIKARDTIPEVITVEVKRENLAEKLSLSAKVVEEEVIHITSSAEAVVEKIYVKVGEYVKKGDVLLELRKDELINTLRKEEFNLKLAQRKLSSLKDIQNHPEVIEKNQQCKSIEWDLAKAKQALEDAKELYAKKAVAYREVEEKERDVKKLQLELEKALREVKATAKRLKEEKEELEITIPSLIYRIKELKRQIQNCVVLSPINGIVKRIHVERNKKVEYGTLLMSISSSDRLVAKGRLKESNFFLVKEGQKVQLTSEVLGKTYYGRVARVLLGATQEGQREASKPDEEANWEVIIQIDNPEGLVVGMELFCEIIVREYQKDVLVIPPEALYEEGVVFVVENGRLKKRAVEIGYSTPEYMEVKSGLTEGDRVVVQYPEGELKEGMKVKERR